MKGLFSLSFLPLVAVASPVVVDSVHKDSAPVLSSTNSQDVPDSYIVVFKKHVTSASASEHHSWVQDLHMSNEMKKRKRSQIPIQDQIFDGLKHTYDFAGGLLGYSGHFDEEVIEQVRRNPDVSFSVVTANLPTSSGVYVGLLVLNAIISF